MRTLLIMLSLCAITTSIKAQGIFGGSHKAVKDTLTSVGLIYVSSNKATDGTLYDLYKNSSDQETVCYFNKNGECYQERQFYKKNTLIDEIEYLNSKFIKVDETSWVNKKTTVKIFLHLPEDDATFYYVSFISMAVKNE